MSTDLAAAVTRWADLASRYPQAVAVDAAAGPRPRIALAGIEVFDAWPDDERLPGCDVVVGLQDLVIGYPAGQPDAPLLGIDRSGERKALGLTLPGLLDTLADEAEVDIPDAIATAEEEADGADDEERDEIIDDVLGQAVCDPLVNRLDTLVREAPAG